MQGAIALMINPPLAFRKSTWDVRLCEHEILGSSISGAREADSFNEQSALPQKATLGRGIAKCARRRGGKPLPGTLSTKRKIREKWGPALSERRMT